MTTRFLLSDVADVARVLRGGGVVAIPTDTVYGVGAWLEDASAVRRLFSIKGRPESVALPVLVADEGQITALGVFWHERASRLATACWPGALTIIVATEPTLAARVGAVDSIGFRVPGDDALRALVRETGPLAVTSANRHGEPPCHTAEEVAATFVDGALSAIVDGGRRDGVVSTVVDLTLDPFVVRRAGAVAETTVARALSESGDGGGAR